MWSGDSASMQSGPPVPQRTAARIDPPHFSVMNYPTDLRLCRQGQPIEPNYLPLCRLWAYRECRRERRSEHRVSGGVRLRRIMLPNAAASESVAG